MSNIEIFEDRKTLILFADRLEEKGEPMATVIRHSLGTHRSESSFVVDFNNRIVTKMPCRRSDLKTAPQDVDCEVCGCPAATQLRNESTKVEHSFCRLHAPPGTNQEFTLIRYRSPVDDAYPTILATNEDSPEHMSLRTEMCELEMLGSLGACRYYLSRLTYVDQFSLWTDEFVHNFRACVVYDTDGRASEFPFDLYTIGFMVPYMKYLFGCCRSKADLKLFKRDRAVVLLIQNPEWTDEQVAMRVRTTVKQLRRNLDYNELRRKLGI